MIRRMSWREFVAQLIGHLAWPVAIVVLAVLFRRQVARLLGRVSSLDVLGNKVDFGQQLARAERALDRELPMPVRSKADSQWLEPVEKLLAELRREAERSPSYAVLESYGQLEQTMAAERAQQPAPEQAQQSSPYQAQQPGPEPAQQPGDGHVPLPPLWTPPGDGHSPLPPPQQVQAPKWQAPSSTPASRKGQSSPVDELRQLRDQVAYGQYQPTPGEAVTYVGFVRRLINKLSTTTR